MGLVQCFPVTTRDFQSPYGFASVAANCGIKTRFYKERLLKGLLRSLAGSDANFLEVCFGRISYGNFHTKATSKKSRPPSGNFCQKRPSGTFSSHESAWKIL